MALLFGIAALMLIVIAARVAWTAFVNGLDATAAEAIIEAMGLLAVAVVALQISQTIAEEEVVRNAQISAPTRLRRFLSRFMVVIVVAVAVEALVATFKAREKPELRGGPGLRGGLASRLGLVNKAQPDMPKSWSRKRWPRGVVA